MIKCWNFEFSATVAQQNNKLSLTKNRWVIIGTPLHIRTPLIYLRLSASWMKEEKPSKNKTNKYGDNESPYQVPQSRKIKEVCSPFKIFCKTPRIYMIDLMQPIYNQTQQKHQIFKKLSFHLIISFIHIVLRHDPLLTFILF